MNTLKMQQAQHILDRCDGDLAKALTYAGFRHAVASIIRTTWPHTLAHRDAQPR